MDREYPHLSGDAEHRRIQQLVSRIRKSGRNKKYDCLVPLSGGSDSCYALYLAKKAGLRPLAYNINNGWASETARSNILKIISKLEVPLKRLEYPGDGWRELYLAALKASIPEVCLPCQIATYASMYMVAAQENIRYVLFGLSPRTEGIGPLRWGYADSRYLKAIAEKFAGEAGKALAQRVGRIAPWDMLYYILIKQIKIIQVPVYFDWDDTKIREILARECDWVDGGGHHFDCIYNPVQRLVFKEKTGVDPKVINYAAMVRSGKLSREDARRCLHENNAPRDYARFEEVLGSLGVSLDEFNALLAADTKSFLEYKTYYSMIKKAKPVIKLLSRLHLLPETAYYKFFEC